ncbi:MAG: FtsB family cell division protein [Campylobacterota bacterium]
MEEKNQLFEGIEKRSLSLFGISHKKLVFLLVGIVGLGIYLGILLFGENSLMRYMQLKDELTTLKQERIQLRMENAKLQKEYFELKEIQPKEEP